MPCDNGSSSTTLCHLTPGIRSADRILEQLTNHSNYVCSLSSPGNYGGLTYTTVRRASDWNSYGQGTELLSRLQSKVYFLCLRSNYRGADDRP